jgi:hypothetical protein
MNEIKDRIYMVNRTIKKCKDKSKEVPANDQNSSSLKERSERSKSNDSHKLEQGSIDEGVIEINEVKLGMVYHDPPEEVQDVESKAKEETKNQSETQNNPK